MIKTVNGREYFVGCNWHERELLCVADIPENVAKQWFYYITGDSKYEYRIFKYRDFWYDTSEFDIAGHDFKAMGFDATQSQSYWDCIAISWFDKDGYERDNSVVVAHVHW